MTDERSVATRVEEVRTRIADAARRAGRAPEQVRLVAATKTQTVERIAALMAEGVLDLGENRAQELLSKAPALAHLDPVWHFIGGLQRNKIKGLAPWVAWWHSVDRIVVADALAPRSLAARVLVEVNVSAEPQKGGIAPAEAPGLVDHLRNLGLDVAGLMGVAPARGDPRVAFSGLRELATALGLGELSMGMSGDYEAAIAEGSTMVRIGTALFGARPTFRESGAPGR